ncbi:MAG: P-loop NTPase fold protein [Ilumatobacteraceae bacterium]
MAALVHRNDRLTTNYDGITIQAPTEIVDGELLTQRQQSSLEYLVESLEADRPASHHASIALTGGWGSGKSRVAYALQELCDPRTSPRRRSNLVGLAGTARPNLVVAIVDVWGVARAQDVSFEIVETALRQPRARARGLWLLHPLPLNRRLILSRIRLRYKSVKADLKFDPIPPSISRLKHVERLARSLSRRQVRLVVVLDELDRAGTAVAQAAISSARRGLDVRGVTTVLVCDTEIMAQKLANPLTPALLDIDSARTAFYIQANDVLFAQNYLAMQGQEADQAIRAVRATYLQLGSRIRAGQERSFLLRYLGGRLLEVNSFGGQAADITDAARVFPQIWRAITKLLGHDLDPPSLTSHVEKVLANFNHPTFVRYRSFERNVSSKLIKHIYSDDGVPRPSSDAMHKAVATLLTVAAISNP